MPGFHHIDRERFDALIGKTVERVSSRWRAFRVFGEIVDLYWRRSEANLALELEACWNELRAKALPAAVRLRARARGEHGTHPRLPRDGPRRLNSRLTQLGNRPGQDQTPSIPTYTLNDGATLPAVGFGTHPLKGEDGVTAMVDAIEAGYRLLDSAVNYENEAEVGEAIRRSGVPRDEVQVTSKLPGRHHGYDDAVASVHGSLERLGLDYLDLHLIHWPNPSVGKYVEAWRALVDLRSRDWCVRSASPTSPRPTSRTSSRRPT